jgi:hypothetical protein
MVAAIVPPTARVEMRNVALIDPAATVTLAGTCAGPSPDNKTTAPPAGAGPVNVAVPVARLPPTTLDAASDIDERETPAIIVICGDDWRLPLSDAVIVAVPIPPAVTMKAALAAPATTATDAATVATDELLLDSETVAPSAGAIPDKVTVPWTAAPLLTFVALSVTPVTVGPVGEIGELEPPHWIEATATITMDASSVCIR